jgi:hypothetical protein
MYKLSSTNVTGWMKAIRPTMFAAVVASTALSAQCSRPSSPGSEVRTAPAQQPAPTSQPQPLDSGVEMVATAAVVTTQSGSHEQMARRDPLGFIQYCWDHYRTNVRDYACVFTKEELLDGELIPQQVAEVRVREEPFSVDMVFVENIRECKRALYVEGMWKDSEGKPQAWAKPGGALIRAVIPRILQPIHGARAQQASRRTIDQFGFEKSFELILQYSRKAQSAGQLKLEYVGAGEVDGRPTYKFERRLPFDGNEDNYPDALLELHIDKELLVPTACYAYSDYTGNALLGKYVYTDVQFNRGFTGDDFDPDKINF